MSDLRFKLPPGGDVPPAVAARRLGLSLSEFEAKRSELEHRGFPHADPTTGNYDLEAIDEWRKNRHPQLFLTGQPTARNAPSVVRERVRRQQGGYREN